MLLLVESRMKLLAFSKTKVLRHHHYLKNLSMLDPQSMVVRDFASSRPLPLTKERKEILSDILSRIVEDVYSVLVDCLKSKYLLQLQVETAHDSSSHNNLGVLPGGVSLRQFAIKELQKLLSNK
ncbi:hypothetical protein P3S68_002132 [Capsicum galapagoense]